MKVSWLTENQDLIKVRGWQVAPAEIEAVLLTHPQVIGAAVLGVPDAQGEGELPRAFVIRKPTVYNEAATSYGMGEEGNQNDVSEKDIKAFVAERLARYKYLDGGVQFVTEIPRNASGKALKAKLRAMESAVKAVDEVADSTIDGALDKAVDEDLIGTIDKEIHGSPAMPVTEFGKDTLSGTFSGTININITVNEITQEDSAEVDGLTDRNVLEKLQALDQALPPSKRNGCTEKIIGEAIESMKRNIKQSRAASTTHGCKQKPRSVLGGKRKLADVLTRRSKRRSLDMTSR